MRIILGYLADILVTNIILELMAKIFDLGVW